MSGTDAKSNSWFKNADFTFTWTLRECEKLLEQDIYSRDYKCVYEHVGYSFNLLITVEPYVENKPEEERRFAVYLVYKKGAKPTVSCAYKISLLEEQDRHSVGPNYSSLLFSNTNTHSNVVYGSVRGSPTPDLHSITLNENQTHTHLSRPVSKLFNSTYGGLRVLCHIRFNVGEFNVRPTSSSKVAECGVGEMLFEAAIAGRNSPTHNMFSDITLKSSDDVLFHCHKAYLSASCKVFFRMLQNDMSESKKNVVEIDDVDSYVLSIVLRYIYTKQFNSDVISTCEMLYSVLYAAEKYELDGLKLYCEKTLFDAVDKTNCVRLLVIANRYRLKSVQERSVSIIIEHFDEVKESGDWKDMKLKEAELVEIILQDSITRLGVTMFVN